MLGFPKELNLDSLLDVETTQIRVGQFDLQCEFGDVSFSLKCDVKLFRAKELLGGWKEGSWPDHAFFHIMHVEIIEWRRIDKKLFVIVF